MLTIGIDAIALAVPEGYVDLADLAAARGVPAGKYVEGLGVTRMAVAAPARGSGRAGRQRRRAACSPPPRSIPSTIGLCVVGTETAVDHSKPVAAYLHRLLGLPQRCRVFEAKHACFGGTAGLLARARLDRLGLGARPQGARRLHRHRPLRARLAGEPTQGAGAVAHAHLARTRACSRSRSASPARTRRT